ncbi:MAG TPA: succinate dehydrogenase cytochrome b subunit [Bryobacteraceae bacterium]|jgi:succinate dehydrogenase / fumarate reductase cytochrome b subunit|nr:succinate dehydrogenase cytochrome b subunit [Bryobacteraceae bacterium]
MTSSTTGIALRFWDSTIGKKAVMAVTGVVLAGFVVGHLLGNLQIFLGPDRFNGYAHALKSLPELLWAVRITLIVSVFAHIWSSIQLAVVKSEARPVSYVRSKSIVSSYASRTMYMSGPIIAAFVIYHLMQFTFGVGGTPYMESDPYGNVINGFRVPAVSLFYILAMLLLCLHLRHGLSSIVQTLGLTHPRYTPQLKALAVIIATLIFFGFVSIPVAVMAGLIPTIL